MSLTGVCFEKNYVIQKPIEPIHLSHIVGLISCTPKSWDSLQCLFGTLIEVYLATIATAEWHDAVIEGSLFWHKLASLHNPSDKPPCPQSSPWISHPLEGHQPFWPPPGSLIPSVLPNVKWQRDANPREVCLKWNLIYGDRRFVKR